MEKGIAVNDIQQGTRVDGLFAVRQIRAPRDYARGTMFTMVVADSSGQMSLSYFGKAPKDDVLAVHGSIAEGDVVHVIGSASEYEGSLGIEVDDRDGLVERVDEYDVSWFVPVSSRDRGMMMSALNKHIRSVRDADISKVLRHLFTDESFVTAFRESPASIELHQAYVGGLLEHTLNVIDGCLTLQEAHGLDRDVLVAGAILHDIGKVEEIAVGTTISMTERGMLVGHLSIGASIVETACREVGVEGRKRDLLVHLVLSSHGEHGPRRPMTPEAAALSLVDRTDASVTRYVDAQASVRPDDRWQWSKGLGVHVMGSVPRP